MRSRCDAASNGRVLDGDTRWIISHSIEAFASLRSRPGCLQVEGKGCGWDRKTNDNSTGCNLKSSFFSRQVAVVTGAQ
jgi:hypothetical protein